MQLIKHILWIPCVMIGPQTSKSWKQCWRPQYRRGESRKANQSRPLASDWKHDPCSSSQLARIQNNATPPINNIVLSLHLHARSTLPTTRSQPLSRLEMATPSRLPSTRRPPGAAAGRARPTSMIEVPFTALKPPAR